MFNRFKKKPKENKPLDAASAKKVNSTIAMLQKGDWETAETLINDLIRRHPNNADCCWLFGRLLANRGQYDAAIFHFKQAVSLVDTHADAYCSYGATLGKVKRYSEEEEMYKKCLELNPSHHICHYNYGCLCEILSDYKNAESHFKQAIELYSNDANYYVSYGILLKTVRRFEESQKMFEIAITIDHDKFSLSNAYYQYGRLLQTMDKLSDAIIYLKKACKLNPQNTEFQRILHIMIRSRPRKTAPSLTKAKTINISPKLSSTNAVVTPISTTSGSGNESDKDNTANENNLKKGSMTPDGTESKLNKTFKDLSYNNDTKRIQPIKAIKPMTVRKERSKTDETLLTISPRNASLTVIEHTNKPMMRPPSFIKNDFSDVNAPGAVDVDDNDSNNVNNMDKPNTEGDTVDEYFQKAVVLYKDKKYEEAGIILKLLKMINPNHEGANRLYTHLSKKMEGKDKDSNVAYNLIDIIDDTEYKESDPVMVKNITDDKEDDMVQKDPCQVEVV